MPGKIICIAVHEKRDACLSYGRGRERVVFNEKKQSIRNRSEAQNIQKV